MQVLSGFACHLALFGRWSFAHVTVEVGLIASESELPWLHHFRYLYYSGRGGQSLYCSAGSEQARSLLSCNETWCYDQQNPSSVQLHCFNL